MTAIVLPGIWKSLLTLTGTLAEVGLPHDAIPLVLLFFNLGVEVGQLLVVAGVLGIAWVAMQWRFLIASGETWDRSGPV